MEEAIGDNDDLLMELENPGRDGLEQREVHRTRSTEEMEDGICPTLGPEVFQVSYGLHSQS